MLVIGVAFLTGFRPDAGVLEWLAVAGMLLLWVLALSWVAVCFGLIARTVEGANGFTFLVLFLPYLSSAFVPVETMRAGLRAVAANQPVTPITETLRGLLLGTPIGSYGWQALAWCAGLLVAAFTAATDPVPPPHDQLSRHAKGAGPVRGSRPFRWRLLLRRAAGDVGDRRGVRHRDPASARRGR